MRGSGGTVGLGCYVLGQSAPVSLTSVESGTPAGTVTLSLTREFHNFAASNIIVGNGVTTKLVRVNTDVHVTVLGVSQASDRGEMYSSIPVWALGTDYFAVTYCEVKGQPCQIDIASLVDGTTVTVTLPSEANTISVVFESSTYTNGDSFVITIEADQVAQIQSQTDLTGTRIRSNFKVAVFSGSTGTYIKGSNENFLSKPMPPVNTWGTDYIAVNTPGRIDTGDYFRIITSETNTVITISGEGSFVLPNIGQWIQRNFTSNPTKRITSDKAVLVMRLTVSERLSAEPGSPSMLVLVPTNQFVKNTSVVVPNLTSATTTTLTVVTKDAFTGSLTVDGSPVGGWEVVEGGGYQTAEVGVSTDYSTVSSSSEEAEFIVYSSWQGAWSGAINAGRYFSDINPECVPSTMSIGDEVDNDCDGAVDEDECTPTDYAGKDCAAIISGTRDVYGTEFVFIFPYHIQNCTLGIYLAGPHAGVRLSLDQPNLNGHIDTRTLTGESGHFTLTFEYQADSDLSNKTLRLRASSEVTAVGYSSEVDKQLTAGTFRLIPIDSVGREYFALTYCETDHCFITVSAVHPDTVVRVHLLLNNPGNIIFDEKIYVTGEVFIIKLAQYESAQILSNEIDMSGTRIVSNKPVSVLSGGNYTKCKHSSNKDMMVEQLLPVRALGFLWAAVQTPNRSSKDFIRVMSTQDNTVFSLTMDGTAAVDYSFPTKGIYQDIELNDTCVIKSDKPIQVAQLLSDGAIRFDSALTLVVPVEQYSSGDHILLPSGDDILQSTDIYQLNVSLISSQNHTSSITLDGNSLGSWTDLSVHSLATVSQALMKGERVIKGAFDSVFGGHVSANLKKYPPGSFSFPLAFKLETLDQPCVLSVGMAGDGVDNDCDGWTDEENCTDLVPTDTDYDGMFDEDCQAKPMDTSSTDLYSSTQEVSPSSELSATSGFSLVFTLSSLPAPYSITVPTASLHDSTVASDIPPSLEDLIPYASSLDSPELTSTAQYVTVTTPGGLTASTSIELDVTGSTSIEPTAASITVLSSSLEPSPIAATMSVASIFESSNDFPLSTTTSPTEPEHSCTCICSSLAVLDAGALTEVVENIRRELTVDKETVSQALRKKTSAPDHRPSAVSMGYVGIAVMSSLFVGIFILDAGSLLRDIVELCRSMKHALKASRGESKA